MKAILFICSLSLLILVLTPVADADIARPKPAPSVKESKMVLHTRLQIVTDSKIYDARLQIPESYLKSWQAELNGAGASTPLASVITQSRTRTIIAGTLLFLSLSFAGVWLARTRHKESERGRARKAIAAVLIAGATLGAAAIITRANAGPPGYYEWRNLGQHLTQGRQTSGGVDVEIVADDPNSGGIKLLIPVRGSTKQGEE